MSFYKFIQRNRLTSIYSAEREVRASRASLFTTGGLTGKAAFFFSTAATAGSSASTSGTAAGVAAGAGVASGAAGVAGRISIFAFGLGGSRAGYCCPCGPTAWPSLSLSAFFSSLVILLLFAFLSSLGSNP